MSDSILQAVGEGAELGNCPAVPSYQQVGSDAQAPADSEWWDIPVDDSWVDDIIIS